MHVVDLTHAMHTGMPVYPGDEPVNVRRTHFVHKHGFAQTNVTTNTHAGTHVDVAAHVYAHAPGLDGIDPECFIGWGVVADCTNLDTPFIDRANLALLAQVEKVDFVLLRTGWEHHWKSDRYYRDFPTVTAAACEYLVDLGIKGIGLDTPSPDPVDSPDLPAHKVLLKHGLVLVENLCNLGSLPEKDFLFSCLPLRIKDAEACPVRAVGMVL